MMQRLVPRTGPLLVLLALAWVPPASAAQMQLTRLELCELADVVVMAEVTSYEVVWDEGDDGGILTRVWFAPLADVTGAVPDTVELLLPGGKIGEVRHSVEDVPERPQLDKRYLLFLSRGADGSFSIVGGLAGAVRIADVGENKGERYIEALASVGACHAP